MNKVKKGKFKYTLFVPPGFEPSLPAINNILKEVHSWVENSYRIQIGFGYQFILWSKIVKFQYLLKNAASTLGCSICYQHISLDTMFQ